MGKSIEIIHQVCQYASISLLVSGYFLSKVWIGVIILLAIIPLLWIIRRNQSNRFSTFKLMMCVCIAAYGLLNAVPEFLMIAGVSFALATWELEDRLPNGMESSIPSYAKTYERLHLLRLGVATAIGLVVAELCLFVKYDLPFSMVLIIAVLVLFSIYRLFSTFKAS